VICGSQDTAAVFLVAVVTHERTGDLGIAKMLEVGFKSTGEIAAKSVTATASATAQANVTAEIDIYKPLWLRESEAQMLAEAQRRLLGAEPEAGRGRKITAVKATEYVIAAKGDKDKAREAARKDGWTL
jgi:hypothetical protein